MVDKNRVQRENVMCGPRLESGLDKLATRIFLGHLEKYDGLL